jgi:hypothetical protein
MTSSGPATASARRRIAAGFVGVVVALLLVEAAFRATGVGEPPVTKCRLTREDSTTGDLVYHCYPSNPNGEFQPAPDVSRGTWRLAKLLVPPVDLPLSDLAKTPWVVEYRRDGPDVRGPAVPENPAPGVVRFAGIGDSFAMGEGVPFAKTLFVQLAKELGPGYEILNAGVSGFNTDGEIRELEFVAPHYHCARALVVYCLNDVALSPAIEARMKDAYDLVNLRGAMLENDDRPWWRRAFRTAEFFAAAAEVRRIARDTVEGYLDAYDPAKNGPNLAAMEAEFRRLATWPGCRVGLVVYPMMYDLDGPYPLQPCHDEVVRRAKATGLPVLDLAPVFAGRDTKSLQVHPIDHHPNGRAHAIAAKAVAPWILAEPTLR